MNEENTLEILKMLVERVKDLERQVLESEMTLLKSGFVAHTPRPTAKTQSLNPDSNTIAKMSWEQLDDLVTRMGDAQ